VATSFASLFAARIGVGLGEAALNPCVVSLVSDYFPRTLRSRAIGLYMAGAFLGAGGAYIVGGQAVAIIDSWPPVTAPFVGVLQSWQTAFLVVAAPGALLATLMMLVPEPPRGGTLAPDGAGPLGAIRHVAANMPAYAGVFLGMGGTTAISASSFWSPVLFERVWGWPVERTGLVIGAVILLTGIPGANIGGWLADRWSRSGRADGPLRTCLVGSSIMLPGFAFAPLMPNPAVAVTLLALAFLGLAVATGVSPAAVAAVSPGRFKAGIAGLFFMTINLLGLFLGPPTVGLIADAIPGPEGIRAALAVTFAVFGITTIVVLWWGLTPFRVMAEQIARTEQ
jgi:MFS family permease